MTGISDDIELRRLAHAVVLPGFSGTTAPPWLLQRLEEGLAGVCLFGQNVASDDQVRELTTALHGARRGVLVTSDEEGGSVTRLDAAEGSPWPAHATLGALDDPGATEAVARGLGSRARAAGVDVVLAPVVDVNSEPDNPVIGERSFGSDPDLVSRHGTAFVRGLQATGVAACAKHYPGHGDTRTDSHVALPVVDVDEATYRQRDLAPFAAMVAAGVRCVMTAHVEIRCLDDQPATMSGPVLRMLREELGFDGVVLSDALDMQAISAGVGRARGAVRALAAGVDLLCIGNPDFPELYDPESAVDEVVGAVERAVSEGELPLARLEEAAARVAGLAGWLAEQPSDVSTAPSRDEALVLGTEVARRAVAVRGTVRVESPALLLVTQPDVSYAAGRPPSALAALLHSTPGWEVAEVGDAAAAVSRVRGEQRAVVLVVAGRRSAATDELVAAVRAEAPEVVVVYGGLGGPPADGAGRTLHSHGGGAAAAHALARLVGAR